MNVTQPFKTTIDARFIPPRNRHPFILQTFDSLQPGEAFLLINDHAPTPLHYQFMHERENQFTWEYVHEGPEVWHVLIGKRVTT